VESASVTEYDDVSVELDVLLAYAQCAVQPVSAETFQMLAGPRGQLADVSAAMFLLNRPQVGIYAGVSWFVLQSAPVLVQQLNRSTQPTRVVLRDRVRGRIDWTATYKSRYASDLHPGVFVCQQIRRDMDRPENQLLKYVLARVRHCLDNALPRLQSWDAWGPAFLSNDGRPTPIVSYLADLAHRVRRLFAHIHLRDVALPDAIDARHLSAARSAKNPLYTDVVAVYEDYVHLVQEPDWRRWSAAFLETIPLPFLLRNAASSLTARRLHADG
jgi:hypothetical protein